MNTFQNLIGMLGRGCLYLKKLKKASFQNLIGMLGRVKERMEEMDLIEVSKPYRYARKDVQVIL